MATTRQFLTITVAVTGLAGLSAGPAGATSVIGLGNSAHHNGCTNSGPQHALQQTGAMGSSGGLTGSVLTLRLSAPANQCGDLGLPKEDKADQPPENAHVDIAE
ncbi:hypothetical protein ADL27_34525 [Streptomyces sp. NRRL F-6602]|nr:hypothetical protein ADL27_34525 [Streptomyces sp. NRRL F-6602]